MISRRSFIQQGLIVSSTAAFTPSKLFEPAKHNFQIGACDWSLGMSSDIRAFDVAKKIGLNGIMVDMGSPENNLHLRQKTVQQQYLDASKRTNIKISSLAMAVLNNYPYKSDPQTQEWVWDSIDVAKGLGVPVILLAFFHKNDLRNDETGMKEVIRRLKIVAPKAEKMNIILGIESYLNAADHFRIMDAVGSKNVKVYWDFRNTADAGFDPVKEMKLLGKDNICELHMKENGFLLGKGSLPWEAIRDCIQEIDYYGDGWMQIESAIPENADIVTSYRHNFKFLQELFT